MNNSINEILEWIEKKNNEIHVVIEKNGLSDSDFWFYDDEEGAIVNKNRSFFAIKGIQKVVDGNVVAEQPILLQQEIGYLGIICKMIDGEMNLLMYAKIEPGNINHIQISPTIQATKSNFTQKHGGKKPAYLEYFVNASNYNIIVDQIQSEQSSRFLGKRNRNIIIEVDENEDIEVLPSHRWMTLSQLKELMKYENLVNMDTRTVLSCIPADKMEKFAPINDEALKNSINCDDDNTPELYQYINNYKMFDESESKLVPLYSLESWETKDNEFVCKYPYSFKVVFCDIEIEGREVTHWTQPLFEATGIATFGLFTCVDNGIRKFLVQAKPEIGCFDKIELAPSVQREYICAEKMNAVDKLFDQLVQDKKGIKFDTVLSEEGGRFYHEQNRNVIIEIDKNDLPELPDGYFWTTYKALNKLVQVNNCLDIQLRNLLSVMEW